jgi:hypothetical protein
MDFEQRELKELTSRHMSDNCVVHLSGGFTEDFAELQRVYLLSASRLFLDSDEPIYTEFNMKIFTKAWHQTRFYEILWGRNSLPEKAAFITEIYETLIENINKYIGQINDKTIADKDPLFQKLTCSFYTLYGVFINSDRLIPIPILRNNHRNLIETMKQVADEK